RLSHTSTLIRATTATLSRSSLGEARAEAVISTNGNFVAYTDTPNGTTHSNVYLYDVARRGSTLVSHRFNSTTVGGNGDSTAPLPSDTGSVVAFTSTATDLVAGLTRNQPDPVVGPPTDRRPAPLNNVFRYTAGSNTLVSHAFGSATTAVGGYTPVLSGDGNF